MTDLNTLAEAVDTLTRESALLHASVFKANSLATSSQVNEEVLLRERFRRKLKEHDLVLKKKGDELRKALADIQSLRTVLELQDDDQKTDLKEITDTFFELLQAEKEAKSEAKRPVQTIQIQPSHKPT